MTLCVASSWIVSGSDEYFYQRKTVVFAEAIYTHWLCTIWKKGLGNEYAILPICPWGPESLPWSGCCRFSPFTFPLPGPVNNLSAEERYKTRKESVKRKMKALTPEQRRQQRQNREEREGPLFSKVVRKRWKKREKARKQQVYGVKSLTARRCAFCRSGDHTITDCKASGKEAFLKNSWNGRFYHRRKAVSKKTSKKTFLVRMPVRCSICRKEGHNVQTCPDPTAGQFRNLRRCSNCWGTGHTARICPPKRVLEDFPE